MYCVSITMSLRQIKPAGSEERFTFVSLVTFTIFTFITMFLISINYLNNRVLITFDGNPKLLKGLINIIEFYAYLIKE